MILTAVKDPQEPKNHEIASCLHCEHLRLDFQGCSFPLFNICLQLFQTLLQKPPVNETGHQQHHHYPKHPNIKKLG